MFTSHPRGLSTLFFIEMWERFSFYGMRGLLLLFMVASAEQGGFGMSTEDSAAIYGLYTALVYLLALPGGWIADRLIGQQKAVFYGGVFIALGHFSMAIAGKIGFFIGLGLIIIGTGLLKPNVSAIVGQLYHNDTSKRDAGFSIFYMGINLGAFLGPLVCGMLGENIDWHLGFGAAGIGMVCGLIQYRFKMSELGDAGTFKLINQQQLDKDRSLFFKISVTITSLILGVTVAANTGMINLSLSAVASVTGVIIVAMAIGFFVYALVFGKLTTAQKKNIGLIFLLFIGYAIFNSGFEQAGSSMNLFAKQYTDLSILSWEMPASWLQSVNALFIIIMAPIMGGLWLWLGHRNPSILVKFSLGLLLLGSGFFVLAWGASFSDASSTGVSPMWLVVTYYLHTIGELCLSPIGLSAVSQLSPKHLVSQMMGIWFMGASLGNLIAGLAAGQIGTLPMQELFTIVASVSVIAGVIYLLISPLGKYVNIKLKAKELVTD
jgi:POT family proton-dependent oligopeptide transporter